MSGHRDPGEETLALLDSQLDAADMLALAERAATNPEEAAAFMALARDTAALRLALDLPDDPPERMTAAARRLQGRLDRQRLWRRIGPIAAAVVLFASGWMGNALWQMPNRQAGDHLVEAALDARAALELRHWMVSQPESPDLDPLEVLAATGVKLPRLPAGWTLRDAQIVATPDRPGIALSLDTPELGPILLLAVARPEDDKMEPPTSFSRNGVAFALFEDSRSAFVLLDASGHPEQLARGAVELLASVE
ncbi:anti-sigma factor family protein [Salipiger sp.]|uniref:anti-sigma factor family protein n=1 Tax=Salipiger sp. TaxID=2078585 RepID=UPI003A985289